MPTNRGRLLPTRVGGALLVLAVLLYLAGSNVGSGWVVMVAALLTGAVAADLIAVARRRSHTRVEARVATGRGPATVEVRTSAAGPGSTRLEVPVAGGRLVAQGNGSVAASWPLRIGPGRLQRIAVQGRTVGPLHLAASRWHEDLDVAVVVPVPVLPAATRLAAVAVAEGTMGHGAAGREIVRGLREHVPGDEARAVHWRATARHGRLLVRDAGRPVGPEVRVALNDGAWTPPAMVLAATVAASLGAAGAAAGRRVLIEVDGIARPWASNTPFVLATIPPLRGGAPVRDTSSVSPPPVPGGAAVHLAAAGTAVLAMDASGTALLTDQEEVERWLAS